MFDSISQSEYTLSLGILEKFRNIISMRANLSEQGKLQPEIDLPSALWKIIKLYEYTLNPSYDIVNTWLFHTFPFSGRYLGDCLPSYWTQMPENIKEEYNKLTADIPEEMIVRPPRMLGQIGWEVDGRLINEEVLMYQNHIRNLYLSGVIDYMKSKGSIRILEIGSGYGALAYYLRGILKPSIYYLVDLPESLAFAAVYLTLTSKSNGIIYEGNKSDLHNPLGKEFIFVPNFLADDICDVGKFDLVINTGSFGEMNKEQVSHYADVIQKVLADDGIFYDDNGDSANHPIISILDKKFKYINFHKDNKNNRLWSKKENILSAMKTIKTYRLSMLKNPDKWLQWRIKRTLRKLHLVH